MKSYKLIITSMAFLGGLFFLVSSKPAQTLNGQMNTARFLLLTIYRTFLRNIEEEIEEGHEDGTKEAFFLLILLASVLKRSRPKARKVPSEQ